MSQPDSTIETLRAFVRRPLAFRCKPPGQKAASDRFIAHVGHYLHSPATAAEVTQLKKQLDSCSPSLEASYHKHNGFVLYRDTLSNAAGVEALPVGAWANATERLHEDVQDRNDYADDDPSGLLSCIVFARAPRSGNLFAIRKTGPKRGAIFYTGHETLAADAPFASDFDEFVSRIISDPVKLLAKDLGCFARYSDGQTPTQWIPEEVITSVGERGT